VNIPADFPFFVRRLSFTNQVIEEELQSGRIYLPQDDDQDAEESAFGVVFINDQEQLTPSQNGGKIRNTMSALGRF
jgi:hypothetical protein